MCRSNTETSARNAQPIYASITAHFNLLSTKVANYRKLRAQSQFKAVKCKNKVHKQGAQTSKAFLPAERRLRVKLRSRNGRECARPKYQHWGAGGAKQVFSRKRMKKM
jgi:hypothetical protein